MENPKLGFAGSIILKVRSLFAQFIVSPNTCAFRPIIVSPKLNY